MPDLHVEPPLYCRAQDLLTIYDDSPLLVRHDELADLVRAMLTQPHPSCVAETTVQAIGTQRVPRRSNGVAW